MPKHESYRVDLARVIPFRAYFAPGRFKSQFNARDTALLRSILVRCLGKIGVFLDVCRENRMRAFGCTGTTKFTFSLFFFWKFWQFLKLCDPYIRKTMLEYSFFILISDQLILN